MTPAEVTAADLLASLAGHRAHYGAAYRHHMDRARSTTGATALAWAIQARAIASGWQADTQDAWTSWDDAQDWDAQDWDAQDHWAAQEALHERAMAAGPDGHRAQGESSELIRGLDLAPADWRTVEAALDRLADEPAYRAVWAGWDERFPRSMLGQSLGYHWPSDLGDLGD